MKEEKEDSYVIGYKGLKNDLSSSYNSKFKYEIGKRYKLGSGQELKLCDTGFHFCRNKENVFNFYEIDGINNYRFFEIKAYGNIIDDEINIGGISEKSVTDEIEIVKEIPIQEFISSPDIKFTRINNKIPENLDLSACKNLEDLLINNYDSLENLPENLKSLYIWYCGSLKSIPENLPKNLEYFKIWNCKNLKSIPKNLPENLGTLYMWNCDSLENLPEILPENLGTLEIYNCNSLKSIPEKLPENLKSFKIKWCDSLKSIPKNLPENLKILDIWNCKYFKDQYWNKTE